MHVGVGALPNIGEQVEQVARGHARQASQHAGEIPLRIKPVSFDRSDQRPQPRGGSAGVVIAGEEPVLAADGDALERTLGGVVVDVPEPFANTKEVSALP